MTGWRRLLSRARRLQGEGGSRTSVPVPTFVSICSTRSYERRNQRDTSNCMIRMTRGNDGRNVKSATLAPQNRERRGNGIQCVVLEDDALSVSRVTPSSAGMSGASCEPHRIDRRQRVRHACPALALILAHPKAAGRGAEGEPIARLIERERMAVHDIVGVRLR